MNTLTLTKVASDYAEIQDSNTYCYEKNGICYLRLGASVKGIYSGWAKIGKLPIAPIDADAIFPVTSLTRTKQSYYRVATDGSVYAFPNDNSGGVDIGSISFPCTYL